VAAIEIPDDLAERLTAEAEQMGVPVSERLAEILGPSLAPPENLDHSLIAKRLEVLKAFLERIPAVSHVSISDPSEPYWWAKFTIDIDSPLAWQVVQELGFVLNYIAIDERLPTAFKPVSPPPYLNGGPRDFLSWVIEAEIPFLDAGVIAAYLEERLPNPVDDVSQWKEEDE
jgi:hypothetical protein